VESCDDGGGRGWARSFAEVAQLFEGALDVMDICRQRGVSCLCRQTLEGVCRQHRPVEVPVARRRPHGEGRDDRFGTPERLVDVEADELGIECGWSV
jgi:hypothetical protein